MRLTTCHARLPRGLGLLIVSSVLASCSTTQSVDTEVDTHVESNPLINIFIDVVPTLQEAVRKAAFHHPSLKSAAIGTMPAMPAMPVKYTIQLSFNSQVDRTQQVRNRDGAVAGGLLTMITGAVVPWSCPTNHQLSASVLRKDGTQVAQETVYEIEKRIETMTWCPNVNEPDEALATKMADTLFSKLEQAKVFSETNNH
jgi:hypothetical protein